MCNELPVILVNRVVDTKRIIGNSVGQTADPKKDK
jgi:hypothetical protein